MWDDKRVVYADDSTHLTMQWGSGLEALADDLLARLVAGAVDSPEGVFARRDCVVAPTRVQQAWLRQRFLYDMPKGGVPPHTLMNCDFVLLPVFLNEWITRYAPGVPAAEDAELAPFAVKNLRWRIYRLLLKGNLPDGFAPVRQYVGDSPDPLRAFKLAGRLARLLDEYQTYRPTMMLNWAQGGHLGVDDRTLWEPELWRMLLDELRWEDTQPAAFLRMQAEPAACGIQEVYRRVFVFSPAMLPGAHLAFLKAIGQVLPVEVFLFNPAREAWFEFPTPAQIKLERGEDREDVEVRHPLLAAYARGSRDTVSAALDLTDGQIEDDARWFALPEADTLLGAVQASITAGREPEKETRWTRDDSLQFHLCHNKLREVQVVRDQILRAFAENPALEPRQIQVQMPDISAYAPYIAAVFGDGAIPYLMADRSAAGESPAATAWRMLLDVGEGRFTRPEIAALLRCSPIAGKLGLSETDVDHLLAWLDAAGIRWGRDQQHRTDVVQQAFTAQTTWQRGLDRLLLGYALGADAISVGPQNVISRHCVNESDAILLGRFIRFYHVLCAFCTFAGSAHTAAEWGTRLDALLAECFRLDNETYRDIAMLRNALALFQNTAAVAQMQERVPLSVVRRFFADHLQGVSGAHGLLGNAVVFSNLRPGSSAPRRLMVLMGMSEAEFPRVESRAAYDLLRGARRMGDRSAGMEDRMAFLEALLHARGRLIFTRVAFTATEAAPLNEAVLLTELKEFLTQHAVPVNDLETCHRLHAFAPDYFSGEQNAPLFSYSNAEYAVAVARATPLPETLPEVLPQLTAEGTLEIPLSRLINFFKNPAAFFHRNSLGVYLTGVKDEAGQDNEAFEIDHLMEYTIREAFLQAIRKDGNFDPAAICAQMTENGILPLDQHGQSLFNETRKAFEENLLKPAAPEETVKDVLLKQREYPETSQHVSLEDVILTGTLTMGEDRQQVFALAGAQKPKHEIAPWFHHVFANALGLGSVQTRAVFMKDGTVQSMPPLEKEKAQAMLSTWVALYKEGHGRALPFAPATSYAHVKEPQKAVVEWVGEYMRTGEGETADLAKAFGKEGPMADAAFSEIAKAVWAERISPTAEGQAAE